MVNAYFVVALFLVFYYIRSQEENADIGKNMYTNWNINYASEKHLGVRLLEHVQ